MEWTTRGQVKWEISQWKSVEEFSLVVDLSDVGFIFYIPASAVRALSRIRKIRG